MKIFVGLGNPGEKYELTRHNTGFMMLDALQAFVQSPAFVFQKKLNCKISKNNHLLLVKPQAFMNNSGQVTRVVLDYFFKNFFKYQLSNLYIIHDDLDIKLGDFKFQLGKGPKDHNGLNSIYKHLGSDQFWHVRVGVDGRDGNRSIPGNRYVLTKFSNQEKSILDGVISEAVKQLHAML